MFAWLAAVPRGVLSGSLRYNGTRHDVQGSGYHDHNWGNIDTSYIFKNWWWMRAEAGPYTLITSILRMKNKYGGLRLPALILLDENGIVAEMSVLQVPTFTEQDVQNHPDPKHGGTIAYTVQGLMKNWLFPAIGSVRVTFTTPLDGSGLIESTDILKKEGWPESQRLLAAERGYIPWYTRFRSTAILDLAWKGVTYHGAGHATVEFMDLE